MKIIIAGAGEVGRSCAEVFAAAGHDVLVIDRRAPRLRDLSDTLDVSTMVGHAGDPSLLIRAGADRCDLFVAATSIDEVNILAASIARGLGAGMVIARAHHSAFHGGEHLDLLAHFRIDHLVFPERLTALEIVGALRDPGVQAVRRFAGEQVEMEQLTVAEDAPAVGTPLRSLRLPEGARVGVVVRQAHAFLPGPDTVLHPNDTITLVAAADVFEKAAAVFSTAKARARRVVISGGTAMGVWLARALSGSQMQVRLFEPDEARATELAEKLPHVTVLAADPTSPSVFEEEAIGSADAFVALGAHEEDNVLAALLAKSRGVRQTIAVLEESTYLDLVRQLGIDRVYSPRLVAAREIQMLADPRPVKPIADLIPDVAAVYEIRPRRNAPGLDRPLKDLGLPEGCVIIAIQRARRVRVPRATDTIQSGDVVVAIAPLTAEKTLRRLFT